MMTRIDRHRLIKRVTLPWAVCALFGTAGWATQGHAQAADPAPTTPAPGSAAPTPSLTQQATEYANLVAGYQERISNLQSQYGPYDERLIEPLEQLTRTLLEVESYPEALDALEQQLQIYRVNEGLYTARQIPVIESRLEVHAATGEWHRVSDTLEYLSWVYERDSSLPVDQQLSGLKKLGDWHLTAVAQDAHAREAFHLLQLGRMEEKATELAELYYGEDSEELTPYIYDQALADTYIALAIMLTGETSRELMFQTEGIRDGAYRASPSLYAGGRLGVAEIESMYGSKVNTVIERSFKNRMSTSLSKLERIKEIYAASGNTEGEGIALMYLGDSVLLRQQYERQSGNYARTRRGTSNPGPAMSYYRDALEALQEAGLSSETLAAYTRCPILLPIIELETSIEEATPFCDRTGESGTVDLGEYDLLSTLIPGLESHPETIDTPLTATIQFDVRTNGQINALNIIDIEPDNTANRVQVRKLTELLQFRPAIQDGRAQPTEQAQLVVRLPAVKTND